MPWKRFSFVDAYWSFRLLAAMAVLGTVVILEYATTAFWIMLPLMIGGLIYCIYRIVKDRRARPSDHP